MYTMQYAVYTFIPKLQKGMFLPEEIGISLVLTKYIDCVLVSATMRGGPRIKADDVATSYVFVFLTCREEKHVQYYTEAV
jgi:hypothetical protein